MFYLLVLKDTVRVAPNNFDNEHEAALLDVLHGKYSNKVLSGHGLCVAVDGFDSKADAVIYANDGGCHVRVQFRVVVFRPFLSEVCVGKIRQSDPSGILVSLEFFDHVFVPKDSLLPGTEFNAEERMWVWHVPPQEEGAEAAQLTMEVGEDIQFRVVGIEFGKRRNPADTAADDEKVNTLADLKPPMRVLATIAEDGLGLLSWWSEPQADPQSEEAQPAAGAGADAPAAADGAAVAPPAAAADSNASAATDAAALDAVPAGAGALLDPSAVPAEAAAAMVDDAAAVPVPAPSG